MYSVVQYTNYRKEIAVSVHGVSASLERAIAFAKECALQHSIKCGWGSTASNVDDADEFSSERCVIDHFDRNNVQLHVWSEADPKRGTHIEAEFVAICETIAADSGAINDFCDAVRNNKCVDVDSSDTSDADDALSADAALGAGAVSLDDMLQEVMMLNNPSITEEDNEERRRAYVSITTQLEARGFNLDLLYLTPGDLDTCAQKGATLPAQEMLADIDTVRRMLAYVWRHGDTAAQHYMNEFELVDLAINSEIFAVMRSPFLDIDA